MKHIMLDLETMGTCADAAIIAIGACEVDLETFEPITNTFYTTVDLQSSVDNGGVIDPSTVLWWLQQSEEARKEFKQPPFFIGIGALIAFQQWILQMQEPICIWGNGADFDNVILFRALGRSRIEAPWGFRDNRCYRTVKNMFPSIEFEAKGVAHNALADALAQAEHLQRIYKVLQ